MNTIEFSHNYTKLPAGIKTAVLMACEPVEYHKQTREFLVFDKEHEIDGLKYSGISLWKPLEPQEYNYLLLCLISDSGAFFTTLRKDNEENRREYMDLKIGSLGQYWEPKYGRVFQIIIKEG